MIFRKSKLENSLSSHETYVMYTSLYSNIGGYCVGLIGGAIYNKLKDKEISDTKVSSSILVLYVGNVKLFVISKLHKIYLKICII